MTRSQRSRKTKMDEILKQMKLIRKKSHKPGNWNK